MAKYTFNVPSFLGYRGAVSLKDFALRRVEGCPLSANPAKVTLFGGYQAATLSNPDQIQPITMGFRRSAATGTLPTQPTR